MLFDLPFLKIPLSPPFFCPFRRVPPSSTTQNELRLPVSALPCRRARFYILPPFFFLIQTSIVSLLLLDARLFVEYLATCIRSTPASFSPLLLTPVGRTLWRRELIPSRLFLFRLPFLLISAYSSALTSRSIGDSLPRFLPLPLYSKVLVSFVYYCQPSFPLFFPRSLFKRHWF